MRFLKTLLSCWLIAASGQQLAETDTFEDLGGAIIESIEEFFRNLRQETQDLGDRLGDELDNGLPDDPLNFMDGVIAFADHLRPSLERTAHDAVTTLVTIEQMVVEELETNTRVLLQRVARRLRRVVTQIRDMIDNAREDVQVFFDGFSDWPSSMEELANFDIFGGMGTNSGSEEIMIGQQQLEEAKAVEYFKSFLATDKLGSEKAHKLSALIVTLLRDMSKYAERAKASKLTPGGDPICEKTAQTLDAAGQSCKGEIEMWSATTDRLANQLAAYRTAIMAQGGVSM